MSELVHVEHIPGAGFRTRLEPPVEGLETVEQHADYTDACGYAVGLCVGLNRHMRDNTGLLSDAECLALVLGRIADVVERELSASSDHLDLFAAQRAGAT